MLVTEVQTPSVVDPLGRRRDALPVALFPAAITAAFIGGKWRDVNPVTNLGVGVWAQNQVDATPVYVVDAAAYGRRDVIPVRVTTGLPLGFYMGAPVAADFTLKRYRVSVGRRNWMTNPLMAGSALGEVGVTGAAPTTMNVQNAPGLVTTITDKGVGYVCVRFAGTATGSNSVGLILSQSTGTGSIPAAPGNVHTGAATMTLLEGATPGNRGAYVEVNYRNSAGSLIATTPGAVELPLVLGAAVRPKATSLAAPALTAQVTHKSLTLINTGDTVNFVIRYEMPQLELGTEATAFIVGMEFNPPYQGGYGSDFKAQPGASYTGGAGFKTSRTVAGVWSAVAANELGETDYGFGVYEARTNSLRNPTGVGTAGNKSGAGAINGNVPTNWTINAAAGLTVNVSQGVEAGLPYFELDVSGTPATSSHLLVYFDTTAGIGAANGQIWTSSLLAKLVAGSLASVASVTLRIDENTGAGVFIKQDTTADMRASIGAQIAPLSFQYTLDGGGTVGAARPVIGFAGSGVPVAYTVRLYVPNFKQGANIFDPPILQIDNLPATRTTDAPKVQMAPPSYPYYVVAHARFEGDTGVIQNLAQLNDNSPANRIDLRRGAAGEALVAATTNGVNVATVSVGGKGGARVLKIGAFVEADGITFVADGVASAKAPCTPPPGLLQLFPGYGLTGGGAPGFHLNGLVLFNLLQLGGSVAAVQALTA